jgi:hypothetical protein
MLIGVLIFAFKVSMGCGLASLSATKFSPLLSSILRCLSDWHDRRARAGWRLCHNIQRNDRHSRSRCTALDLFGHCHIQGMELLWPRRIPSHLLGHVASCPASLAAASLSCSSLASLAGVASWKAGLAVGIVFFFAIMGMSEAC